MSSTTDSNKIYIINMIMSSPNHLDNSEEIDDKNTKLQYTFTKAIRQKISTIRTRYRRPIYTDTLNFHSLHICRENQVEEIKENIKEADIDMKNVDPRLYSYVHFIPLDMASIEQGEMYQQIAATIKLQVFDQLLKTIDTDKLANAVTLPPVTKKALLKMINHMKQINVLNDPAINTKIATLRGKILNNDLVAIRDELKSEVINLKISRATFLEY